MVGALVSLKLASRILAFWKDAVAHGTWEPTTEGTLGQVSMGPLSQKMTGLVSNDFHACGNINYMASFLLPTDSSYSPLVSPLVFGQNGSKVFALW